MISTRKKIREAQARKQSIEKAKAALDAVSPEALNQLAKGFTDQLAQVNLTPEAKAALIDLINQAMGTIGHLRDLVVLNREGANG